MSGQRIEGEAVGKLARAQSKERAGLGAHALAGLGQERLEVGMDGERGGVEVALEDAVRAVQRATRRDVQDLVSAAEVVWRAGTRLDGVAARAGEGECSLPAWRLTGVVDDVHVDLLGGAFEDAAGRVAAAHALLNDDSLDGRYHPSRPSHCGSNSASISWRRFARRSARVATTRSSPSRSDTRHSSA